MFVFTIVVTASSRVVAMRSGGVADSEASWAPSIPYGIPSGGVPRPPWAYRHSLEQTAESLKTSSMCSMADGKCTPVAKCRFDGAAQECHEKFFYKSEKELIRLYKQEFPVFVESILCHETSLERDTEENVTRADLADLDAVVDLVEITIIAHTKPSFMALNGLINKVLSASVSDLATIVGFTWNSACVPTAKQAESSWKALLQSVTTTTPEQDELGESMQEQMAPADLVNLFDSLRRAVKGDVMDSTKSMLGTAVASADIATLNSIVKEVTAAGPGPSSLVQTDFWHIATCPAGLVGGGALCMYDNDKCATGSGIAATGCIAR